MDRQLAERLNNLTDQGDQLTSARNSYLLKEAERKHFESRLIKAAEGKSQAEKTINAQATFEWLEFHQALAMLEGEYEFHRLRYEILDKAWMSEQATYKLEERIIKKQGA